MTDRETERQTDTKRERDTDRKMDRDRQKQAGRQKETQKDRQMIPLIIKFSKEMIMSTTVRDSPLTTFNLLSSFHCICSQSSSS